MALALGNRLGVDPHDGPAWFGALLAACVNIVAVLWCQTPSPATGALAWPRLLDDCA